MREMGELGCLTLTTTLALTLTTLALTTLTWTLTTLTRTLNLTTLTRTLTLTLGILSVGSAEPCQKWDTEPPGPVPMLPASPLAATLAQWTKTAVPVLALPSMAQLPLLAAAAGLSATARDFAACPPEAGA